MAITDPRIAIVDDVSENDADMETILENHNREDLKWWQVGQQWRKYRDKHDITQEQLADMLPDISLDYIKRVESASQIADYPELVIIITNLELGYNSASHVMRIPGGAANWEKFLKAVEAYDLKVKAIDSYTKSLAELGDNLELLGDLLDRICEQGITVDEVKDEVKQVIGAGQAQDAEPEDKITHQERTEPDKEQIPQEGTTGEVKAEDTQSGQDVNDIGQDMQQVVSDDHIPACSSDGSTLNIIDETSKVEVQSENQMITGVQPAEAIDINTPDKLAQNHIETLKRMVDELPGLFEELDNNGDFAEIANSLYEITKEFIITAARVYPLGTLVNAQIYGS